MVVRQSFGLGEPKNTVEQSNTFQTSEHCRYELSTTEYPHNKKTPLRGKTVNANREGGGLQAEKLSSR